MGGGRGRIALFLFQAVFSSKQSAEKELSKGRRRQCSVGKEREQAPRRRPQHQGRMAFYEAIMLSLGNGGALVKLPLTSPPPPPIFATTLCSVGSGRGAES